MMSATIALQQALVARLAEVEGLAGVYHDAPARAQFPYAVLNCNDECDWSCKGREGREIALQLVIWDERPSRLLELEAEVEERLRPLVLTGAWNLSSLILTGKRRTRDPSGPWSCLIAHRARVIAADGEVGI